MDILERLYDLQISIFISFMVFATRSTRQQNTFILIKYYHLIFLMITGVWFI